MALLAIATVVQGLERFSRASAIDFYHIWGVRASARIASEQRPNPYTAPDETAALLNRYVDEGDDEALTRVNANRRRIDTTGTPFFYSTFLVLPFDFATARASFFILQYVAFAAAVVLLFRSGGIQWPWVGVVGFLMVLWFRPFAVDVRVGNVNSCQLLFLVCLAMTFRRSQWRYLALIGVAAVTLWKPNVLPITLLLLVAHAARTDARGLLLEAAVGLATVGLLVAGSSMWFGDAGVWMDWFQYMFASGTGKLSSYPIREGNLAFSGLLARLTGHAVSLWTLVTAALLGATTILAFSIGERTAGRREFAKHVNCVTTDPWFAMSAGICVAAAISPLMWRHYFTWVAAAPLWLICTRRRPDRISLIAGISLLLYWEPPGLIEVLGVSTMGVLQSCAWMLPWLALLMLVAEGASQSENRTLRAEAM